MLATAKITATQRIANSGIARKLGAGQYAFARATCSTPPVSASANLPTDPMSALRERNLHPARANFQRRTAPQEQSVNCETPIPRFQPSFAGRAPQSYDGGRSAPTNGE